MSTNAPLIAVNSLLAAKIETVTGAAETLAAADATLICRNAKLMPSETFVPRERIGGMGNTKGAIGSPLGTFTGEFEAVGSGVAATSPAYALAFFPACNLVEATGAWTPTTGQKTLTIGHYEDGKLKILYGARGDLTLMDEPGKVPYWKVDMQGIYNELTDTALLSSVTFPTVLPDLLNRTFTFNSYAAIISKMEIGMKNAISMRQDAGNGTTRYRSAMISQRDPYATFDPEETVTGTIDWQSLYTGGAEYAFNYVLGSTTGNIITVASAKAQVRKRPRDVRDGILVRNIEAQFNETASAGPLSITFG